jgi:hypothetical protein
MDATTQAVRDVQSDNPYYRVTRWVLPAGAATGEDQDERRATLLPSATGQLLLKKQDGEQPWRPLPDSPLKSSQEWAASCSIRHGDPSFPST